MLRWFRREEKEEEPLRLPQEMIDARLGKIQRNCKWIRRVVLVLIAYCALNCLWSIGMAFTTSNDNFIEFYVNEKLPPNVVYGLDLPATAAKSMGTAKTAMACYFIVAIAGGIFGIWAYDTLQETLKDVANGKTPFSMTYVKRVKKMGVIFMLLRPCMMLVSLLMYTIVGAVISSQVIYLAALVPMSSIIMGGLMLCLAGIFEYGCLLQVEYDDTV